MILFVGIDPGTTSAFALVDAESSEYFTKSRKEFSKEDIEEEIVSYGDPVVIASDVKNTPSLVKNISSTFGIKCFSPKKNLSIEEKKSLTKGYDIENDHERDALSAALYAKGQFKELLGKIDAELERKDKKHLSKAVKKLMLKGEAPNIEMAIRKFSKEETENIRIKPKVVKSKKIIEQRNKIKQLSSDNKRLRKFNEKIKKKLNELEKKLKIKKESIDLDDLRKVKMALKSEKRKNKKLRKKIRKRKEIKNIKDKNYMLKRVQNVSDIASIENKPVLLENESILGKVDKENPKFIITNSNEQGLYSPVINVNDVNVKSNGGLCYVSKKEIKKHMGKDETFFEWLESYKKRYKKNK